MRCWLKSDVLHKNCLCLPMPSVQFPPYACRIVFLPMPTVQFPPYAHHTVSSLHDGRYGLLHKLGILCFSILRLNRPYVKFLLNLDLCFCHFLSFREIIHFLTVCYSSICFSIRDEELRAPKYPFLEYLVWCLAVLAQYRQNLTARAQQI